MAEISRLAKGHFTSTGAQQVVNLPFVPDVVELWNYTASDTPAQNGVPYAYWDNQMGQGYAIIDVFNATPALITNVLSSGGISTFSGGYPQLGAAVGISGITKASPAVVTTTASHGYATGDVVVFTGLFQSASTGMPQICGMPFTITVTGATTFTIPWNTNQSSYTALSGSPSGAYVRKVLYPYLYFPGTNFISAITTGTSTTIDTTTNHNLVVGSEVAFRIPTQWGSIELNTPNSLGNPVYGFVTSVTDANTVVVNVDSTGVTAFSSNPTVAQAVAGMSFPQMVTVGDNNTGALTNSFIPTTINPISIGGAFQNNTRQGFIVGAGASSQSPVGAASDVVYWRAYIEDYAS